MSEDSEKWAISTDGEIYQHQFDTIEDAIDEGKHHGGRFFVGRCIAPEPPENLFDRWSVDRWIDSEVREHDDYSGEWASDAIPATREQQDELAQQIRPVIAAWLDRHKLRPTFFNIDPASVREINE